jgi:hypothetical protein
MMNGVLVGMMLLLASVGQSPTGEAGVASGAKERAAYKITLNTGREMYGFWEEREDRGNTWRVEVDAPWKREKDYQFINKNSVASTEAEWRGARETRIAKGWKDAGFSDIGDGRHYSAQEVALAGRAREMAVKVDERIGEEGALPAGVGAVEPETAIQEMPAQPVSAGDGASASAEPAQKKDLNRKATLMRWGRHLGFLLMGCGGIFLIVRKFFPSGLA